MENALAYYNAGVVAVPKFKSRRIGSENKKIGYFLNALFPKKGRQLFPFILATGKQGCQIFLGA
jgi:hypothetical protein